MAVKGSRRKTGGTLGQRMRDFSRSVMRHYAPAQEDAPAVNPASESAPSWAVPQDAATIGVTPAPLPFDAAPAAPVQYAPQPPPVYTPEPTYNPAPVPANPSAPIQRTAAPSSNPPVLPSAGVQQGAAGAPAIGSDGKPLMFDGKTIPVSDTPTPPALMRLVEHQRKRDAEIQRLKDERMPQIKAEMGDSDADTPRSSRLRRRGSAEVDYIQTKALADKREPGDTAPPVQRTPTTSRESHESPQNTADDDDSGDSHGAHQVASPPDALTAQEHLSPVSAASDAVQRTPDIPAAPPIGSPSPVSVAPDAVQRKLDISIASPDAVQRMPDISIASPMEASAESAPVSVQDAPISAPDVPFAPSPDTSLAPSELSMSVQDVPPALPFDAPSAPTSQVSAAPDAVQRTPDISAAPIVEPSAEREPISALDAPAAMPAQDVSLVSAETAAVQRTPIAIPDAPPATPDVSPAFPFDAPPVTVAPDDVQRTSDISAVPLVEPSAERAPISALDAPAAMPAQYVSPALPFDAPSTPPSPVSTETEAVQRTPDVSAVLPAEARAENVPASELDVSIPTQGVPDAPEAVQQTLDISAAPAVESGAENVPASGVDVSMPAHDVPPALPFNVPTMSSAPVGAVSEAVQRTPDVSAARPVESGAENVPASGLDTSIPAQDLSPALPFDAPQVSSSAVSPAAEAVQRTGDISAAPPVELGADNVQASGLDKSIPVQDVPEAPISAEAELIATSNTLIPAQDLSPALPFDAPQVSSSAVSPAAGAVQRTPDISAVRPVESRAENIPAAGLDAPMPPQDVLESPISAQAEPIATSNTLMPVQDVSPALPFDEPTASPSPVSATPEAVQRTADVSAAPPVEAGADNVQVSGLDTSIPAQNVSETPIPAQDIPSALPFDEPTASPSPVSAVPENVQRIPDVSTSPPVESRAENIPAAGLDAPMPPQDVLESPISAQAEPIATSNTSMPAEDLSPALPFDASTVSPSPVRAAPEAVQRTADVSVASPVESRAENVQASGLDTSIPAQDVSPALPFDAPTTPSSPVSVTPEAVQRTADVSAVRPVESRAENVPAAGLDAAIPAQAEPFVTPDVPMPAQDVSSALPFDPLPSVSPPAMQVQRQPDREAAPTLPFDNLDTAGALQRQADESRTALPDESTPAKMDVFQALVAAGMVARPIGDTGGNAGPLMQRSPAREAYLAEHERRAPAPVNEPPAANIQRALDDNEPEMENEATPEQETSFDVDKLARDVYKVLRSKLRDEFDRTNKR